jgi:hypothetical protein
MTILYRYNGGVRANVNGRVVPGGGNTVALSGFKLNAEFISTAQTVPNSVLIPLLGGGSVQLTNDNKSGSISFAVTRTAKTGESDDYISMTGVDDVGNPTEITDAGNVDGTLGWDLVSLALQQINLQGIDSSGATISCSTSFNGVPFTLNLEGCTVVSCEPIRLAGNDVPTYNVVFNYHTWRQID